MEQQHNIYWSRRKTEILVALEYAERQLLLGAVGTRVAMNDSLAADIGDSKTSEEEK